MRVAEGVRRLKALNLLASLRANAVKAFLYRGKPVVAPASLITADQLRALEDLADELAEALADGSGADPAEPPPELAPWWGRLTVYHQAAFLHCARLRLAAGGGELAAAMRATYR